jgi:hypothetical protein
MSYKVGPFTGGDVVSNVNDGDLLDVKKLQSYTLNLAAGGANKVLKFNSGGTAIEALEDAGVTVAITEIDDTDSPYSVLATDDVIWADSTSGAITVTLPDPATWDTILTIKDAAGNSTGSNKITISQNGSETIDGETSIDIKRAYGSYRLVTNGTNWAII